MAARARCAEPALTEEQLLRGLRHLWRPGWPRELAAVLTHPLRGPAVRGMARQLTRQPAPAGRLPATGRTTPPQHTNQLCWSRTGFDAKRAAANDLKDD